MRTIVTKSCTVRFHDNEAIKARVFDRLISFYFHHGAFSGESIMQSDGPTIDAPTLLSEIADDIIKFQTEYTE